MPVSDVQNDFLSKENFELAWERVLRSTHANSKDRIALRVFSSGIDYNLDLLREEIEAGVYTSSVAHKIYIPKASRTLRTIPVLSVSDRIVYQAIGNILIREAMADISVVANRHVFAHIPQSNDSLFTLKHWRNQFRGFTKNYENIWKQGHRWVVEADIASFYASVDHQLLIELIRERWIDDDDFLTLLSTCLRMWTSHENGPQLTSGLPQGYETSDLLSTIFLLPVDEELLQRFNYLRYVDDFRILTTSRDLASKALVILDLALKSRSLILQSKKTGINEVEDLEDEKNKLRRKLSQISIFIRNGKDQQDVIKEMFFAAWNKIDEDKEISDTILAFSLYRLGSDSTVRNIALRLLDILPWRSGIVNKYLEKFLDDPHVIRQMLDYLVSHNVYGWHLANCIKTIGRIANPTAYRRIALNWITNRDLKWFQRLAAVFALADDLDSYAALYASIRNENHLLVKQALIVVVAYQAYNLDARDELIQLLRQTLEDANRDLKRLAIWLYKQFPDLGWTEIGFDNSLGSLNPLVPELADVASESPCFIKNTFRQMYEVEVSEELNFEDVFEDYDGTVSDLRKAIPYFYTDPSLYIGLMNSFNHRIAIALKPVVGSSIPNDEFGNMMRSNDFRNSVPQVALYFQKCNDLRNQTTGFHPFDSAVDTWSTTVDHKTKNNLHKGLKLAYQEFVTFYEENLDIAE
jgi:retron-type reverse transcriptase